jgi:hypothetical protein
MKKTTYTASEAITMKTWKKILTGSEPCFYPLYPD